MLRRLRPMRIVLGLTFIVALLLTTHDSAWAQGSPGTIKGIVRDGESGDLLDYANVIIKGTTRGTMSLGGGAFYFIESPEVTPEIFKEELTGLLSVVGQNLTITVTTGDEVSAIRQSVQRCPCSFSLGVPLETRGGG